MNGGKICIKIPSSNESNRNFGNKSSEHWALNFFFSLTVQILFLIKDIFLKIVLDVLFKIKKFKNFSKAIKAEFFLKIRSLGWNVLKIIFFKNRKNDSTFLKKSKTYFSFHLK